MDLGDASIVSSCEEDIFWEHDLNTGDKREFRGEIGGLRHPGTRTRAMALLEDTVDSLSSPEVLTESWIGLGVTRIVGEYGQPLSGVRSIVEL